MARAFSFQRYTFADTESDNDDRLYSLAAMQVWLSTLVLARINTVAMCKPHFSCSCLSTLA